MKKYMKIFAVCSLALTVISCQQDETTEENNEIQAMEDVVSSEMDAHEVESDETIALHEACDYEPFKRDLPSCATVDISGDEFPKTITIDFGSGCEDNNGRTKTGKVIIVQSAQMIEEGATRTITFEDFAVNNTLIAGTRTVTNTGANAAGNIVFSVEGDFTGTRNGRSRTRKVSKEREWIAGAETCDRSDDEFLITGSATITCRNKTITRNITEAIHVAPGSCKYPLSGKVHVDRGRKTGEVDFGDGTCDNIAIVTKADGSTKEIDLDERRMRR